MNFIKKMSKSFLFSLGLFLILTVLLTVLNYFNIFNSTLTNIFKIIIPIVSILIGSIVMGKNSTSKGWLEGLKIGLIFAVILFLFNYLALDKFNIIVYLLVIATSIIGGMVGINFRQID